MSSLKVVVLGNGQLGKSITTSINSEFEVVVIDKKDIDFSNLTTLKLNLHILLDGIKVLCFINCIAYTNIEKIETEDSEIANIINGYALKILGEYCCIRDVPLIHFSCNQIFNGESDLPYVETDKPDPINKYGKSKLIGEKILLDTYEKVLIFRISWLYSVYSNTNFVFKIIDSIIKGEDVIVPDDQFGNLCNVFDLSKILMLVISKVINDETPYYGVYHVSSLGFESKYNISQRILKTMLMTYPEKVVTTSITPSSVSLLESKVREPLNCKLNSRKFFNTFDFGLSEWIFSLHNATQKIVHKLTNLKK